MSVFLNRLVKYSVCASLVGAPLIGCGERGGHSEYPELVETAAPEYDKNAAIKPASNSINWLACDLYRSLSKDAEPNDNLFFSPASISTALMLVYEGSQGQTREQFDAVLGFDGIDSIDVHRAYARMIGGLALDPDEPTFVLDVANALWGEKTMPFKPDYLDTVTKHYEASFASADFKDDPIGQRDRINAWVSEKTKGRIDGILSEDAVTSDTRLILANAMYFKGRWAREFWDGRTKDTTFYAPGKQRKVPMMHQREAGFRYGKYDGYAALQMWYDISGIYMLVLLPDERDGLAALEKKLSPKMLSNTVEGLQYETVNLWLPKWETTHQANLKTALTKLGLKDAFDGNQADFTGISDATRGPLFLSQVSHKAFIAVDEEGTEAAAVTALIAEDAAEGIEEEIKPINFRADRPFIYLIRDRRSGAVLFMGRVLDPS